LVKKHLNNYRTIQIFLFDEFSLKMPLKLHIHKVKRRQKRKIFRFFTKYENTIYLYTH